MRCIQLYLKSEEKEIISKASDRISLTESSFCRSSAIKEAHRILEQDKKIEVKNGANR